jgi:hypothetical protein
MSSMTLSFIDER